MSKSKLRFRSSIMGLSFLLLMAIFFAFGTGNTIAANGSGGQEVVRSTLESGETLDETGFFSGQSVRIDGNVEGTAIATGTDVRINGNINGDLIVAAQNIYINGTVFGNIYAAGQNVTVGTQSKADSFIAGQYINIGEGAVLGRDSFVAGQQIVLNGTVQRSLFAGGQDVSLGGTIGRDANLDAESLKVTDGAEIKGDLSYTSSKEADVASGSVISGKTDWKKAEATTTVAAAKPKASTVVVNKLISIAGALLIWFLVKVWRPKFWGKVSQKIKDQPLKSLGAGLLALIVTPIAIILIMITIVGAPLGVIAGLVYGVSIYLSKIVVAVFIGSWIAERFKWPELHKGVWFALLGLVILAVLSMIPVVRVIVGMLTLFAGLGSLILANYKATAE